MMFGATHFNMFKKEIVLIERDYDKTTKMTYKPSEDSYQSGHQPSLIRTFGVRYIDSTGLIPSSGGQRRLWANVRSDLSLRWAKEHFVGFVVL